MAPSTSNSDIAQHMKLYEPIKQRLEKIQRNVTLVDDLKNKDRQASVPSVKKEIMAELDTIMSETTRDGAFIKNALDQIKEENSKFDPNSAKTQMRTNLYQTHIRRFHQVMNSYNSASHEFKQHLQDTTRRQLGFVNTNLKPEEIEKIVESGRPADDVIKQHLMSDPMLDIVNDVEERHADIMKLEQQVLEVYELFRDLATLVDLQQESLDVIEYRVANAKAYSEKAEIELITAEKYQTKARKRKCCLVILLLVVLVVILAPILATQLGKG